MLSAIKRIATTGRHISPADLAAMRLTDEAISGKSIDDIKKLAAGKEVHLTSAALLRAFEENDVEKLRYLHQTYGLKLHGKGTYHIDVAVETGNQEMASVLIQEFNCQPSPYAVIMGQVNGNMKTATYAIENSKLRDAPGISTVHRHMDPTTKKPVWRNIIPEQFRSV